MSNKIDYQQRLNQSMPAAADIKLGDVLQEILTAHNALVTAYNGLLAKLDLDATVTDEDYEAEAGIATAALKDLNDRA